ncbi:LysR family transcriptional regulator [Aneurinibacillus aneurinilyticus]|uniref:LysR family transcriptional regulator n=1 Tax=Aneurinibacillus aneurinilyticus TaxID=1391 RepID=A0A848D0H1_ANEAE|nr:LysR family transcriptional regulator [Aneurinibacillus aneurinilyticus]MCI1695571.1 LysR family transcriptional regulator [Aneurinibacillus aneurinilyticus]MED0668877.1 LysR family transcriptional regulator [Aneurinibacillus aneurinilyticus]NME99567.1 LysR family transcriptional regulator [Aneurinibacillus aneurinilyticus]
MTLTQLEVFMAVVKEKSFTKAGLILGMTQSAVSHVISSLEAELGISLLVRDRRGVKTTEAGERVLVHVREILYRTSQIQQDVSSLKKLESGTIKIGSFPSVSARLLPRILSDFQVRYPGIELILFEGTNQEVRNWIHTGAVDVGFVSLPDEEFDTVSITQDEMVVILPESHPLAHKTSILIENIKAESFILTKGGCEGLILRIFHPFMPRIQFEVRETGTILTMVQQGLGITILPAMAIPSAVPHTSILHLNPPIYRQLGLAVRSLKTSALCVLAFIEHVQNRIQTNKFE